MSAARFVCPKTGHEIDPGIEEIESASSATQFTALHVRCAHCGEHHEIKIEEAALNEAA
jgi:phage terminase large subunit GpA-like protein